MSWPVGSATKGGAWLHVVGGVVTLAGAWVATTKENQAERAGVSALGGGRFGFGR